ncbi:uncharacterized protein EI90DRAFT_3043957 [Cantharellus anzutake]|uniref:uncharacterized protein n=1 Tax=Cantharellus anzutake TaxID=1750568 RepID=UPI0019088894|nr:uncharacterized protein EI90DRAFT_3043957 [Cantharellus anzutake]KAF8336879.1 hypothetical protein EI90DRAFT_3043957 [Cantharellus anzutake]
MQRDFAMRPALRSRRGHWQTGHDVVDRLATPPLEGIIALLPVPTIVESGGNGNARKRVIYETYFVLFIADWFPLWILRRYRIYLIPSVSFGGYFIIELIGSNVAWTSSSAVQKLHSMSCMLSVVQSLATR